jgi:hypothetical protein
MRKPEVLELGTVASYCAPEAWKPAQALLLGALVASRVKLSGYSRRLLPNF